MPEVSNLKKKEKNSSNLKKKKNFRKETVTT
jgi:hypothetical protein